MQQLMIAERYNVKAFSEYGIGIRTLIKKYSPNERKDFTGLYVFYEDNRPFYVGISRSVISRIRQHVLGRTHNDASLVFKMASTAYGVKAKRKDLMADEQFRGVHEKMKDKVKSMTVSFIQVENDLVLYLLEVYVAMKLDTSEWNTFRTH